jgi:acetylornithine deacetylase
MDANESPSRRTVDILRDLVSFPTTSERSNLELIEYVEGLLRPLGAKLERTYDDSGEKANLLATLGPSKGPGLILSGHTDVVPVEGQSWQGDPWDLREEGQRLHGRGSCDMKGFLACMLALAEQVDRHALSGPLYLAFSYDEERGLRGVRRLIEAFADSGAEANLCVVGEPTEMQVGVGHKSILQGTCIVTGSEAHSSLEPHAANALYGAARLLTYLEDTERSREAHGPFDPGYSVPHSTVQAAVAEAGVALNIVPREARFGFEFRCIPSEDARDLLEEAREYGKLEVLPRLAERAEAADIEWRVDIEGPGLDMRPDHEAVQRVMAAAEVRQTVRLPYATEAGLFHGAGIPTVVCGPGSIEQAHRPDEYVALSQLGRCERFLTRLLGSD